jgi:hypothetical protein
MGEETWRSWGRRGLESGAERRSGDGGVGDPRRTTRMRNEEGRRPTVARTAAALRVPETLAEQHGLTSTAARLGATRQTRRAWWEELSG